LTGRKEIEALVKSASQSLRSGSGDEAAASRRLYQTLFGNLGPRIERKTRWLIVLDEGLFEAPLAALQANNRYLVEQHSIERIPGVGLWLQAERSTQLHREGRFLGVGDAIYNTADSRLGRLPGTRSGALQLPRLVASAGEVESCARIWDGDRTLLEGQEATRENLRRELARHPAVVHLSTHVVESAGPRPEGLIALSLTPVHENQLLGGQEIAGWRTDADLVVMNGCHSAGAPALPGTGLLGLTRAWLSAGAHTVIASYWATPDENGMLFQALYQNLRSGKAATPATALRAAQLEMIRSGDWRSTPRYWGAYFEVGTR
jgi:CHAT domain-containing protein